MKRIPLVAVVAAAALAFGRLPCRAQGSRTVLQAIDAALSSDQGFSPAQRAALASALRTRFADYGLQTATGLRSSAVQVALHMLVEGSFDEVPAERAAEVAFAAYQAVTRGAPPEVVEGIGLYGYRKRVPAALLSAWANGYTQMTSNGVPADVAADLVRAAMENDWDEAAFDILKWSIVHAAKERFNARDYSTYLLGHMLKGGKKPGALTGEAQTYFKRIAKTGERPVLPPYEGSFSPLPVEAPQAPPKQAAPPAAPAQAPAAPQPSMPSVETAPRVETVSPPPNRPAAAAPAPRPPARKPAAAAEGFARLWPGLERASKSYLGTPYVWGGMTHRGIDCSALTQNSYGENTVAIPRVSQQQWKTGTTVSDEGWREGDLVFFNTLGHGVSHVGMIVDPKGPQFIHASSSKGVMIADLSKNYYKTRYLGARRVVP